MTNGSHVDLSCSSMRTDLSLGVIMEYLGNKKTPLPWKKALNWFIFTYFNQILFTCFSSLVGILPNRIIQPIGAHDYPIEDLGI